MATTRDVDRLVRDYIDPGMYDNVFNSKQLLKYCKQFAKVRPYTRVIKPSLEYLTGVGGEYADLTVLDRSRKEIAQLASYNLSDNYAALTVSWQDRRDWTTPEAVVDGLQLKARNAQKTLATNLTTRIVSGSASASPYQIIGYETIMPTSAATLGGLTTTEVASWDNQRTPAAGVPTIPMITELFAKCSDGSVTPDTFAMDKFVKAYIQGTLLQPQERYTTGKFLMGEDLPLVVGVPIITDAALEDGSGDTGGEAYVLNKDSLFMGIHSKDNMKYWPYMRPADQFAFSAYWTIALQQICVERRRLGLLYTISGVL